MVQFFPPRVTHRERQIVLQEEMEENTAILSGIPHTPSMAGTTRGILPPNPPSLVCTTMVSITFNLGSGLIPSMAVITAMFTKSAIGPSLSYEMLGFDMNSILSSSTL
jgi:hypothetical protein